MSVFRLLTLMLILSSVLGCATSRQKRLSFTGAGFVAGAALGGATAPAHERKELHALYWGGLVAVAASVLGDFLWSSEDEAARLKLENEKLKADFELLQNAKTVLLREGEGRFKTPAGSDVQLPSGKARWRLYEVDRWVKDGPDKLVHQDKVVEILPASTTEEKSP